MGLPNFKRLWFLYIGIVVGILVAGVLVYAYTFEGEIDPKVFMKWEVVEGTMYLVTSDIASLMVENPDKESRIKRVQIFISRHKNMLLFYRYFKNGEVFHYYLEGSKYVRRHYTAEQLENCMKCHKGIGLHCS